MGATCCAGVPYTDSESTAFYADWFKGVTMWIELNEGTVGLSECLSIANDLKSDELAKEVSIVVVDRNNIGQKGAAHLFAKLRNLFIDFV